MPGPFRPFRTFLAFSALGLSLLLAGAPPRAAADDKGNAAPKVNTQNKPEKRSNPPSRAVLDINSASKDELKSLPGIGETYAERIIDNRPYKDKGELQRRNVLPPGVYNVVRDRVTASKQQSKPVTSEPTK